MDNVAVVGSRNFGDADLMFRALDKYHHKYGISKIISGGAKGADSLAETWARENNVATIIEHPQWDNLGCENCVIKHHKDGSPFNVLAGYNRNISMAKLCDVCIAFWDGGSKGTNI